MIKGPPVNYAICINFFLPFLLSGCGIVKYCKITMSNVLLQLQRIMKGKAKLAWGTAAAMMLFNFKHSFMSIITSCDYIIVV